jgi:hypothetical protein
MSIIKTIPQSSRYIQVDAIFTATFNNPTLNKYDFGIAANTNVVMLEPLTPTSIYIIDRYSFSANIAEGVFLESIDTIPTAQYKLRINPLQIYQKPIPCINYVDNAESIAYFYSKLGAKEQASRDAFTVDFRGVLNQVPATVGQPTIKALLSVSLYEIIDKNFTQQFRQATRENPQSFQVF